VGRTASESRTDAQRDGSFRRSFALTSKESATSVKADSGWRADGRCCGREAPAQTTATSSAGLVSHSAGQEIEHDSR